MPGLVIASEAKQSPCKGKIASSPLAPRNAEIIILRQVGAVADGKYIVKLPETILALQRQKNDTSSAVF